MAFPWLLPTSDVQDPAVLRRRVQFRQDLSGKMEQQRLEKFMELCEWIENQVPIDGFKMDVQIVKMPHWDPNNVESRHCFTNIDYTAKVNGQSEDKYRHQKRRPDTFMVKIPLILDEQNILIAANGFWSSMIALTFQRDTIIFRFILLYAVENLLMTLSRACTYLRR